MKPNRACNPLRCTCGNAATKIVDYLDAAGRIHRTILCRKCEMPGADLIADGREFRLIMTVAKPCWCTSSRVARAILHHCPAHGPQRVTTPLSN